MAFTSQKIEKLLELSLNLPEELREQSRNLSAGYDEDDQTWEVIFRYSENPERMQERYPDATLLRGGYGILQLTRSQLQELAMDPQIEFIEKPKELEYALYNGKLASCIPPVQAAPLELSGEGIFVAVIDSGIDLLHPDFREEDGSTRIMGLWDQTQQSGDPPEGYRLGTYYTEEAINAMIRENESNGVPLPTRDTSGHGTHVAGIAAGNGRASRGEYRGVAYRSKLLVVKLESVGRHGFPGTGALMQAVDFVIRRALEEQWPIAINLSYGNSYGSHTGTSLLETYLDEIALVGRNVICIGSGNEGASGRHQSIRLENGQTQQIEFSVAEGERSLGLQIWKNYRDVFRMEITSPSGQNVVISENIKGQQEFTMGQTILVVYAGEPSFYSTQQEIYLEFFSAPPSDRMNSGVWKIQFIPVAITEGNIWLWLPAGAVVGRNTRFLVPSLTNTFTIPSTAIRPVTVGAYDSSTRAFAAFSGQGSESPGIREVYTKPDLVAPGVDIVSAAPGGGYTSQTGTSMACPFVTGSAALLMEYGIVKGNDPYLYGQKVKAYLTKGARSFRGIEVYPNAQVGWGSLCLRDSLPQTY